jgi:serine protease Do
MNVLRKFKIISILRLTLWCWLCGAPIFGGQFSRDAAAQIPPMPTTPSIIAPADAAKTPLAALPLPSASARELFAKYKERLVQVRVLFNSANEQSSLGSGFVVRDDGAKGAWFITNYHVVSSLAINPEKYRLELRQTNERTVKAKLIAVDVLHDLAVLRSEPDATAGTEKSPPWTPFALRDTALTQGEKVFSLGNPLELGFLISEGIYNGGAESKIYEQMLFSGALNSGMSGGPAIDEAGRVVGVNVSTLNGGALLSFLVPIRYVRDLLTQAWQAAPRKEWRTEIAKQLLAHQAFVVAKLLNGTTDKDSAPTVAPSATPVVKDTKEQTGKAGFASQTLSGRIVPTLDGNLTKCWAGGRDGEKLRYQRDTLSCALRSSVFVRSNLQTGSLALSHTLLRNDKLATPQFLHLDSSSRISRLSDMPYSGGKELTRNECQDDYVRGALHVYRVSVCLQTFQKFEGLYNFDIKAIQMDDPRERLSSNLVLNGVSFENGQRVSRLFLERLQ